jgi:hypothetical protein
MMQERASEKQRKLIRFLEDELDPPTRLSHNALMWLTKRDASDLIIRLNKLRDLEQKKKQLTLL